MEACPYLDEREVLRVLRAELRVAAASTDGAGATKVLAVCSSERLVIEVTDPVSRKILRRNFGLREPDHPGMSRLVGIAAAELVLASWAELALNPHPKVAPEGAPPAPEVLAAVRARVEPPEPRPAATERAPGEARGALVPSPAEFPDWPERARPAEGPPTNFRILALGSRRAFFEHTGALWGGGARVGSDPLPFVSWSADFLVEAGEIQSNQRRFEVQAWTVGWQIFGYKRISVLTLKLGAGLRAGFTDSELVSSTDRGGAGSVAPWGWPLLVAGISVRAHEAVLIEVTAEGSYVALPVSTGPTGDTLRGAWFGAQLGMGIVP